MPVRGSLHFHPRMFRVVGRSSQKTVPPLTCPATCEASAEVSAVVAQRKPVARSRRRCSRGSPRRRPVADPDGRTTRSRPPPRPARRRQHACGRPGRLAEIGRALEVVAARRTHDEVGVAGQGLLPGHADRLLASRTDGGYAACGGDHLRDPVTRREGRVGPLEQQHPRSGAACGPATSLRHPVEPVLQRLHERSRLGLATGGGPESERSSPAPPPACAGRWSGPRRCSRDGRARHRRRRRRPRTPHTGPG